METSINKTPAAIDSNYYLSLAEFLQYRYKNILQELPLALSRKEHILSSDVKKSINSLIEHLQNHIAQNAFYAENTHLAKVSQAFDILRNRLFQANLMVSSGQSSALKELMREICTTTTDLIPEFQQKVDVLITCMDIFIIEAILFIDECPAQFENKAKRKAHSLAESIRKHIHTIEDCNAWLTIAIVYASWHVAQKTEGIRDSR
jgi:hypothetical protein